ncbi:MAG: bifunctional 5,10-methylene-tetrahydrofolate dehydrogenase/5,10-methylene-tetrahydrofolate cyclohydrolase [Chitinophagales bacterium]|nr:bifunctional 5,10-methylene-tetrahydrofolate dehydrogenase/5,10-methylene-tetrahydrofolate cyclohydrolase [Chitinophagales bacterium]
MQLLDGKLLSQQIKLEIAEQVRTIKINGGKKPCLAAILVGNNGASETYVASKVKSCQEVGFDSKLIKLPADTTERELLTEINKLNNDDQVDGFIVQLPLPKHIREQKIIEAISPEKDVDGFHPNNMGKLALGLDGFVSATPNGIIEMLKRYNIPTEGKNCVVLGRSNIVGTPMSLLMSRKAYPGNATVTLLHSKSEQLREHLKNADIIIAAIGIPEFLKGNMVKEGAVVVDVGISRVPDASKKSGFTLKGDVKFDEVAPKCSYISPVPGGVGLMTVTSLLLNTLKAATRRHADK